MARLYDNGDTLWLEDFGNSEGDLFGQAFLYLQATGEHFGDAGEFGESDDTSVGDVANVHLEDVSKLVYRHEVNRKACLSKEWNKVVLA